MHFGTCPKCGKFICLEACFFYRCQHCHKFLFGITWDEETSPSKPQSIQKPIVVCPYCKSTDTKKISELSRYASTELLGVASNKIGKEWHCNKCNSNF